MCHLKLKLETPLEHKVVQLAGVHVLEEEMIYIGENEHQTRLTKVVTVSIAGARSATRVIRLVVQISGQRGRRRRRISSTGHIRVVLEEREFGPHQIRDAFIVQVLFDELGLEEKSHDLDEEANAEKRHQLVVFEEFLLGERDEVLVVLADDGHFVQVLDAIAE